MNTIKIFLDAQDGATVADLRKDFNLYQHSFRNKLLNVYVPVSILAPEFSSYSPSGEMSANSVDGTAVKIGMTYTARDGQIKKSKSYYLRYVKTLTHNGIEYALYEKYLPKEFTKYAGQGQNAPELTVNVVNIDYDFSYVEDPTVTVDTEGVYYIFVDDTYIRVALPEQYEAGTTYYTKVSEPSVLSVVTSQICALDVMPSTELDIEEVVEPSEFEELEARVNDTEESIANLTPRVGDLEDRVDVIEPKVTTLESDMTNIKPRVATLESNVSELQTDMEQAQTDIGGLQSSVSNHETRITNNSSEIATIKQQIITGKEYIGQMKGSVLPTDNELNAFVVSHTSPSREAKNGDTIYFVLEITGQPDKRYEYIYTIEGWKASEIPNAELGSNTEYGLVKGNYDTNQNVEVSIIGGEVKNVYAKDKNGTRRDIQSYLSMNEQNIATNATEVASLKTRATNLEGRATSLENRATAVENDIDDIIDGGITVKKAEQDGNGNNIVNTYLTQNAGATKEYVKGYALPKSFNDSYFLANKDEEIKFISTVPTLAEQVESTITTSAVGEHTLLQANWYNGTESVAVPYEFEISKKNSCNLDFAVSADRDCSVYFMVYGYLVKGEEETDRHLLFTTRSNVVNLTADNIETVNTTNIFTELAETMKVVEGNRFEFEIGVYTEFSTATEFTLYSNNVFSTDFLLNTTSQTIVVAQGELGEQPVYQSIGLVTESGLEFEIVEELKEDTEALFKLSYQGETLADTTEVIIKNGEETIRLVTPFNMASGNATIGDLKQLPKESGVWIFKGFIERVGSDTILRADMLNLVGGGGEWGSITGNIENQTDLAGRLFNVINASDIASTNILTEAQYAIITNGKPTIIKGSFRGYTDAIYKKPVNYGTVSVGVFEANNEVGGYIIQASRLLEIRPATTSAINLRSVGQINGKSIPTYPTDTTKQYKLVQNTDGTLVWVEDTKWGNIDGNIEDQTDLAEELQDIREIAEGRASAYIIDDLDDITGTKGADDNYTNVTAINSTPEFVLANAKLGDSILVKDETIEWDYWVSQINKTGDEITSVNLNKTKAIDLSNYVDLDTAQTVTGEKNFSNGLQVTSRQDYKWGMVPTAGGAALQFGRIGATEGQFNIYPLGIRPNANNQVIGHLNRFKRINVEEICSTHDGTPISVDDIATEVEMRIIR